MYHYHLQFYRRIIVRICATTLLFLTLFTEGQQPIFENVDDQKLTLSPREIAVKTDRLAAVLEHEMSRAEDFLRYWVTKPPRERVLWRGRKHRW